MQCKEDNRQTHMNLISTSDEINVGLCNEFRVQ